MASRADFTHEEWDILANAPDAAGLAVLAANPDGAVREREAMLEAWRESAEQPFADNQLVLTLIRNRDAWGEQMRLLASGEEALSSLSADEMRTRALDLCRRAMALLERKATPQDRQSYGRWVIYLMHRVAGAVKSGPLRIDLAEQAVIRELTAVLEAN